MFVSRVDNGVTPGHTVYMTTDEAVKTREEWIGDCCEDQYPDTTDWEWYYNGDEIDPAEIRKCARCGEAPESIASVLFYTSVADMVNDRADKGQGPPERPEAAPSIDGEAYEAIRDLLDDHVRVTASLADVVIYADKKSDRDRARRALVVNARALQTVVSYLAKPPSIVWALHREPLTYGGEEWTVHS